MSEQKGLSILFAKRYPTKQGVFRAEQAQARENDYATGEGNEKSHPRNLTSIAKNTMFVGFELK